MPQRPLIVHALRLRWRDNERAAAEGDPLRWHFDRDAGSWLSLVWDWLAAWRGAVRRDTGDEITPRIRLARVGGDAVEDGGGQDVWEGRVHFPSRPVSTPAELRAAFIAASEERELPPEHRLFAEAVAFAAGGRLREAVIVACTAVEVLLAGYADTLLTRAGRGDGERGNLLKVNGVADLYRLCASDRQLPASFGEIVGRLAGPRNDAAHHGVVPDEGTVEGAITTARLMLALSPLLSARSLLRERRPQSGRRNAD